MKKLKNIFKSKKEGGQSDEAAHPSTSSSQGPQHQSRLQGILPGLLKNDVVKITVRAGKTSWPPLDLHCMDDLTVTSGGQPLLDFADGYVAQWSHGKYNAPRFGEEHILLKNNLQEDGLGKDQLPPLLFDLQTRRVVSATEVEPARYTFVSHVWGRTVELDGSRFNVGWKIPIRSEAKLEQIFEAARVLVAERFIWIDVLCLDQNKKNGAEVGRMQSYLENSAECLVWLDNEGIETRAWDEVLDAIAGVNEFFKLDCNGVPTISFTEWKKVEFTATWNAEMCLEFLQRYKKIELAPWFQRVWTLQEGVIPNKMFFCTPERYVTGGFYLFTIMGICESMARTFFATGDMLAVSINSELQSSELFKIRALRRLYQRSGVSFWHLVHAVRSRSCTYEQDRVFGVLGLLKQHALMVDYNQSLSNIYDSLFKACVNGGDFYACLFLGQEGSLLNPNVCSGLLASPPMGRDETHNLSWTPNGIQMRDVGVTPVGKIWLIVTSGAMRLLDGAMPSIHQLNIDMQKDVAKAFNTSTAVEGELCPGALAGVSALVSLKGYDVIKSLGKDITREYEDSIARGIHSWMRAQTLYVGLADDYALVVVWSEVNDPQIAVLTDFPGAPLRLIMHPSSTRGACDGCIIAIVQPDGSWRKIGIGLGRSLTARSTASFLLTNTVSDLLTEARAYV